MYRGPHPRSQVSANPESQHDGMEEGDFVGSTAGRIQWLQTERPRAVVMVTECSMADNVAAELPETEFTQPCNMCPHMKRITLTGIRDALRDMQHEVVIDVDVAVRARVAVGRMLEVRI